MTTTDKVMTITGSFERTGYVRPGNFDRASFNRPGSPTPFKLETPKPL